MIPLLALLSGCVGHRVGYFETNPAIYPSGKKSDLPISISFRLSVEDSFPIVYPKVPKTVVSHFKRTLAVALNNTFKASFRSVVLVNTFSGEGLSLVFTKVEPKWYKESETSMGEQLGCETKYHVIVYLDGKWHRELSGNAHSLISGQIPLDAVSLLRSSLTIMCVDLYKNLEEDFNRVGGGSGSGTGFLVSNNGYIMTNSHVIESASSIKVKGINGDFSTSHPARMILEDKANDLALLKIDAMSLDTTLPYMLRPKNVETGEDVFVLGYPLITSMGEEIKLTTGIVSSRSGYQGSMASYQISAQVQPGNSGSPVFDRNGSLVGVVNSKIMGAEGVTYVIKPTYVRALFENAEIPLVIPAKNTTENLSLSEKIKVLSPFVYIIEVEK